MSIFLSYLWVSSMSQIKFCNLFVTDKMDGFVYLYIGHLLILIHPFQPTFPIPSFCFWTGDFHLYKIKNISTDKNVTDVCSNNFMKFLTYYQLSLGFKNG